MSIDTIDDPKALEPISASLDLDLDLPTTGEPPADPWANAEPISSPPADPEPEPATEPERPDDRLRPAVRAMVDELDTHYKGGDCPSIDKTAAAMKAATGSKSWDSRGQVADAVKAYRAKHEIEPKPAARTTPPRPRRTTASRPVPTPPEPDAVRAESVPVVQPEPVVVVQPAAPDPVPPALDVVQPESDAVHADPVPVVRNAGLGWSRFGFALGVIASTAANIAHSFTPSAELVRRTNDLAAATGQSVDWSAWTPPVGTIIAAAFWPIALVVSVEVLSRVVWPAGWRWKAMRFGGVTLVAAVAAFISYKHLHGLISSYGEDAWSAAVGPLAIDGLMLVCSAALLAIGQNKRSTRKDG